MAAKAGMIAAGTAGVLALATGGYFVNEWRVCRALGDDYRTFAMRTLVDQRMKNLVNTNEFDELVRRREDAAVMKVGQTLFDLQQRCGEKAALEAQLDAQKLILGT